MRQQLQKKANKLDKMECYLFSQIIFGCWSEWHGTRALHSTQNDDDYDEKRTTGFITWIYLYFLCFAHPFFLLFALFFSHLRQSVMWQNFKTLSQRTNERSAWNKNPFSRPLSHWRRFKTHTHIHIRTVKHQHITFCGDRGLGMIFSRKTVNFDSPFRSNKLSLNAERATLSLTIYLLCHSSVYR